MKKKILLIIVLVASILLTIFILKPFNKEKEITDNIKFKKEYEKLNNKDNINVTINENNPFIYSNSKDIINRINNKETFVIYFGFNTCPWCRSVLPTLMEVSEYLEVDKIYYVDISDIRDTMIINDDNELETTKEGTKEYNQLLELFDSVLEEYTLEDKEGNTISTDRKRIYAPSVVTVVEGEVIGLETGLNDDIDITKELTKEDINIIYDNFYKILDDFKIRESMCGVDQDTGC